MENQEIRLVLKALDEKFEKEKERYEVAKEKIRDLCKHEKLDMIMAGNKCTVCGKILGHQDTRVKTQYIRVVRGVENLTDEHKQFIKENLIKDNEAVLKFCSEEVK